MRTLVYAHTHTLPPSPSLPLTHRHTHTHTHTQTQTRMYLPLILGHPVFEQLKKGMKMLFVTRQQDVLSPDMI